MLYKRINENKVEWYDSKRSGVVLDWGKVFYEGDF